MNIEFRKSFEIDLRNLKDRKIKRQIQAIIEEIESAKSLTELRNVKAIQGYRGCYRSRIGDYRLGLYLEQDIVALVRLLHRKEMYRYFP
ncbi:MAG: type II toxin-antitoxin system RelE/ParE family toxin [Microcystis aeruginosa Ma_QC_Ca_00000000_S207]|uniref:Type II toxin-antitoxin system RelE/ParE family toxin n=1 Tax=Microcystis aeruginosa Ma_QC_Ca_00000000_S207 TaxID=2486251 RepID=A0A552G0F8_MICAE|nr:MAG: type II toxin-antitoxin system RelE/ParE family toxin [Microcystis aeruginosa Ma_QC_Ca_00000000_S207]